MVTATTKSAERRLESVSQRVWDIAATVCDPEVPVLTIEDLGVLRSAELKNGVALVTLTPTYSGCPAMDTMKADVESALHSGGFKEVKVTLSLAPAWTTDWMSEDGKRKLEKFGIAPPSGHASAGKVSLSLKVKCPRCGSLDTKELTRFGSTSCKALYSCNQCLEPFDYFKVH
ncbi:MAG: phenylacetate-CoA oxygenase subunit PaaJ [Microbacteriaceae bacterium]|nr:phenylacetate-CoA oxygenase subunit PaaJ [Cryobacterium sp.]MBX3103465.1 phenylacetate-CoA oxygenase subunit PaaJ [Cryobacterium sp.]MCC6375936.1 phenylacetate-CoA oxygenase subunit PaaJ [Microbacteriaceae bacterium]